MKKYNVRISLHTFVDVEVEAESKDEAIQLAEQMDYDMGQLFDNLTSGNDMEVTEIEPDIYDMKYALEKYGWDWNVLDMMDDWEIKKNYEEIF